MRRLAASLIGVFALLLAGCAGVPGAVTPRPDATPVEAFGCGVPDPGTPAGAVPAGFAPVAAYLCDPYATQDDAQGTWSGSRLTRYEGDLGPLLAELRGYLSAKLARPKVVVKHRNIDLVEKLRRFLDG